MKQVTKKRKATKGRGKADADSAFDEEGSGESRAAGAEPGKDLPEACK